MDTDGMGPHNQKDRVLRDQGGQDVLEVAVQAGSPSRDCLRMWPWITRMGAS